MFGISYLQTHSLLHHHFRCEHWEWHSQKNAPKELNPIIKRTTTNILTLHECKSSAHHVYSTQQGFKNCTNKTKTAKYIVWQSTLSESQVLIWRYRHFDIWDICVHLFPPLWNRFPGHREERETLILPPVWVHLLWPAGIPCLPAIDRILFQDQPSYITHNWDWKKQIGIWCVYYTLLKCICSPNWTT